MNLLENGLTEKSVLETNNTKTLVIGNHTKDYPIYKIRLDKLFYNDQNDRISTWISKYKMENNVNKIDCSDKESYNKIIHNFITESNYKALRKTQQNIKNHGQIEIGVVLSDGRIIDGNRRFTCLRNIQEETQQEQYFKAVILDYSIKYNEKEIKMLELMLQHATDEKVGYSPIERLVGVYHDIVETKLLTKEEYAKSINDTVKNVEIEVEKAKLLEEFLEFIDAEKQFYVARDLDLVDPVKELYKMLRKINDEEIKEDLKNVIFSQFISKPAGDLTRYMRKINDIASNSKHLKNYLKDLSPVVDEVCEKLEETNKNIGEKIGEIEEDLKIKDIFSDITKKYTMRVAGEKTRDAPLKSMKKACNDLDEIDLKILDKLKDNQIEELKGKIDELKKKIEKLEDRLEEIDQKTGEETDSE